MKSKILIPMVAFVFAIGMSFTTERSEVNPSMDYYLVDGVLEPIGREIVECEEGTSTCRIQFVENGPIHEVYDAEDSDFPKSGSAQIIQLWRR